MQVKPKPTAKKRKKKINMEAVEHADWIADINAKENKPSKLISNSISYVVPQPSEHVQVYSAMVWLTEASRHHKGFSELHE